MAKKKEVKKDKTSDFNLNKALKQVNEFIRPGFHWYLINHDIKVKNQKEFDKYLKEYGG